jgi:mitochondrial fission protein ELM1
MQPPAKRPLTVWMLDDGKPGHWSMTDGLAGMFAASRDSVRLRVPLRWRPGWARQILQRAESLHLRLPERLVRTVLRIDEPSQPPDLILSRGGATLFANAWLARKWQVPNVFIGTIRGMPESLFRAVVLQREGFDHPPYFRMPLQPTRIDPTSLPDKVDAFPWTTGKPAGAVACLFLGGDGSGYRYTADDWQALALGMQRMHERCGVKWCVASSRRTPAKEETHIMEALPAAAIHEACWYHAGDRRPCVEAFLGVAGQAFCTEDSMTMLEECIASGKPVLSLGNASATPGKAFLDYLTRRQNAGLLRRLTISDFAAGCDFPISHIWAPVAPTAMRDRAAELLRQLDL